MLGGYGKNILFVKERISFLTGNSLSDTSLPITVPVFMKRRKEYSLKSPTLNQLTQIKQLQPTRNLHSIFYKHISNYAHKGFNFLKKHIANKAFEKNITSKALPTGF